MEKQERAGEKLRELIFRYKDGHGRRKKLLTLWGGGGDWGLELVPDYTISLPEASYHFIRLKILPRHVQPRDMILYFETCHSSRMRPIFADHNSTQMLSTT
jgi:hypothetical protein